MESFKQNIARLPDVSNLQAVMLFEGDSIEPVTTIENKPGKSASVKIYHYLGKEFGSISPKAAEKGLEIYAEYVDDARQHPGSHPNIDLLFDVIKRNRYLVVRAVKRSD